jgi:uncharacterized membrane protein YkvA (DUF1232 family)
MWKSCGDDGNPPRPPHIQAIVRNRSEAVADDSDPYSRSYSEKSFWEKLAGHARTAGEEIVERALQLHYALQKPSMPAWAKAAIYGALGYFIVPLDAVPDIIPGAGFVDDLGVLAFAFATVAGHIDDDVRAKARAKLRDWFGPAPAEKDKADAG